MHFLLFYELAPDYLERRPLFRAEHLALAWQAAERGELLLGGAVGEPVELALLLFRGDSPEVAERFAAADPYFALAQAAPASGLPDASSLSVVLPEELEVRAADHPIGPTPPLSAPRPQPPLSTAEPLTEALSRLHLTVPREFLQKLEAARDALSHSRPDASSQEVLEAGLDLVLQQAARPKGLVARPRKTPPPSTPDADHVPAAIPARVRREVWQRDQGRCQWRMQDGRTCGSTHRLELDHIVPRARGGPSTAANLRVLCRSHNLLAARLALGDAAMDRFTRTNRSRTNRPRPGADARAEGAQSRA